MCNSCSNSKNLHCSICGSNIESELLLASNHEHDNPIHVCFSCAKTINHNLPFKTKTQLAKTVLDLSKKYKLKDDEVLILNSAGEERIKKYQELVIVDILKIYEYLISSISTENYEKILYTCNKIISDSGNNKIMSRKLSFLIFLGILYMYKDLNKLDDILIKLRGLFATFGNDDNIKLHDIIKFINSNIGKDFNILIKSILYNGGSIFSRSNLFRSNLWYIICSVTSERTSIILSKNLAEYIISKKSTKCSSCKNEYTDIIVECTGKKVTFSPFYSVKNIFISCSYDHHIPTSWISNTEKLDYGVLRKLDGLKDHPSNFSPLCKVCNRTKGNVFQTENYYGTSYYSDYQQSLLLHRL